MPVPGGVFQSHLPGKVKVESLSKLIASIKNFCEYKEFLHRKIICRCTALHVVKCTTYTMTRFIKQVLKCT